jgi:hypothetical protein
MVMVLLNLSYIPDQVVEHIDFQPGWSVRFKLAMILYKDYFEQQTGRKWEY